MTHKKYSNYKAIKFTVEEVEEDYTYFNNTPMKHWTVTGLALLFGSRQLLDDHQKTCKPYTAMITKAKTNGGE